MAVEYCKLVFGNHKGARGICNIFFVETCKLARVSVLGYFKIFFNEVRTERTDYENL